MLTWVHHGWKGSFFIASLFVIGAGAIVIAKDSRAATRPTAREWHSQSTRLLS